MFCFLLQSVGYGIYAGLSIAGIQSYYLPLFLNKEPAPFPVTPFTALILLALSVYMITGAGHKLDKIAELAAKRKANER